MNHSNSSDKPLKSTGQSEQYARIIEFLDSGIFLTDQEGRLEYVNPAFLKIFGWRSAQEICGRRLIDIIFSDANDGQKFMREIAAVGVVRHYLIKASDVQGREMALVMTGRVLSNKEGRLVGLEGSLQDITEFSTLQEKIFIEKQKLEQLLRFDEEVGTIRSVNQLLDFIVQKTCQILQADKCSLMLYDPKEKLLSVQSAQGLDPALMAQAKVAMGESIAGSVAQQKTSLWVKDIAEDRRFARLNRPRYLSPSFMSAAICREDNLIGVLNVNDKNVRTNETFGEVDFKVLKVIARQAAVSIENARLYGELEQLSKKDPLTNLDNYRSFVASLDQEIARVNRYTGPLSLLMIDIDDFKKFNDTYGHIEGDRLLITVSEILRSNLRSVDKVCRYGGDEFAVILPRTEIQQALCVAEKLRVRIEELAWKDKVTISVGAAAFEPGMTRFDLISRADQGLYRAKKAGKNCAVQNG